MNFSVWSKLHHCSLPHHPCPWAPIFVERICSHNCTWESRSWVLSLVQLLSWKGHRSCGMQYIYKMKKNLYSTLSDVLSWCEALTLGCTVTPFGFSHALHLALQSSPMLETHCIVMDFTTPHSISIALPLQRSSTVLLLNALLEQCYCEVYALNCPLHSTLGFDLNNTY